MRYARAVENDAVAPVRRARRGASRGRRGGVPRADRDVPRDARARRAHVRARRRRSPRTSPQETWLAVLEGIDRFEGRSSLKTWIFRILTNRAKTRGIREGRSLPFSALEPDEPAVEADRFHGARSQLARALGRAAGGLPRGAAARPRDARRDRADDRALPPTQRAVISLRDVEGWSAEEVCNASDAERDQSTCPALLRTRGGSGGTGAVPRGVVT